MSGYPRNDGDWCFYIIESWYNRDPQHSWKVYVFFKHFDTRELAEALGLEFRAVSMGDFGDVWQEGGMYGTRSERYARAILGKVRKEYPQHDHRIKRLSVTRTSVLV